MFKNIIPRLVSFDTELKKINGFYFSDNFNFYEQTSTRHGCHYKVVIDNEISIPKEYDFRDGYFFRLKTKWYYERRIGFFTLKFCYDTINKIFSINTLYSFVPFEFGGISPAGKHLADIVNLDLLLKGYIVFKGCAFSFDEKVYCVIAPGFNGKTNLVKRALEDGGRYVAEDCVIIDFRAHLVYPSSIQTNLFARRVNRELQSISSKKIINVPRVINRLFLMKNHSTDICSCKTKKISHYLHLCSLRFARSSFMTSYIFEEDLIETVSKVISTICKEKIDYVFFDVENFDFNIYQK